MQLYSAAQVAKVLKITPGRVRVLAHSRGLGRRIGERTMYFTQADIDAMRIRRTGRPPSGGRKAKRSRK